jgi:hypothetical protein
MSAAATRQAPATRPWTHYVNDHFFDRLDLEPGLERLAFRLERLAREKAWCITSNDELRDQLGCSRNTLAALLIRGESRGWFRRVLIPGRHGRATGRLGIVLLVRPTDRPVANDQTFDQVVDHIRAEIRRGSARSRTLPFPALDPQELGTAVPKNWAPSVPKNWAPPSSEEEGITGQMTETTTTWADSAQPPGNIHALPESSSVSDPEPGPEEDQPPSAEVLGETPAPETPAADASTHEAPSASPAAAELPAELISAAAEAIPGASREWVRSLLRDCGGYGLNLALLVLAWVKVRRPDKPARYARSALAGWLNKLRAGELTVEDVRAEVRGRTGPRASPRPFDPAVCLARLESLGWTIVPHGADRVIRIEIPDRGPPLWTKLPEDLRQQVELHKAEVKAYVLRRASERGKAVGRGA